MAYRASAKTPGLMASSSAATRPASNEISVAPSHPVKSTRASAASAGHEPGAELVLAGDEHRRGLKLVKKIGLSKNGCSL